MSDEWDMDKAYPPILWKDYRNAARPLVAEWVRCAGLTCDNEYALDDLADRVRDMVVKLLIHGGAIRLLDLGEHLRKEGEA
jgi:hypothetical protein